MNLELAFILAIAFTLGVSALCSTLEAMILSTTAVEIEALKKKSPRRGLLLERFKLRLDETISTILTLNTLANTLGATLVGGLAMTLFGQQWLAVVSAGISLGILIFSEIIPKNLGVAYRVRLQNSISVFILQGMITVLRPVTYFASMLVRALVRGKPSVSDSDEEILLLAQKGAKEGNLTKNEMDMIANALTLDNIRVSEIMTPRTVVTAIDQSLTVGEVFRQFKNIPFGRMPVFSESIDEIVGLVRRRDLLQAMANGEENKLVRDLKHEVHFIPETVTAAALQIFLKTHQQLAVVVDEFGSVAGVVTMEDIMEHIIGREIFEKDDLAIDMRELARARALMMKKRHQAKSAEAPVTH